MCGGLYFFVTPGQADFAEVTLIIDVGCLSHYKARQNTEIFHQRFHKQLVRMLLNLLQKPT